MDIIALILLCFRIKNIVKPKGHNASSWVWRTVLFWICAEIAGFSISLLFQKDIYIGMISGLLCAVASYFYVQNKAIQLPDLNKTKDWKDYFNQD